MILVIFAHPYPDRSRANRALLDAVASLDGVVVRSLYDLYPDFAIDVEAEQALLREAAAIVFQHPVYWYTCPSLMQLYFEKVLCMGFAYGKGGDAVTGKSCLWALTTGGDEAAYTSAGIHQHPFEAFVPVMRQTTQFCHMRFEEPFVVHGAHRHTDAELSSVAERYRDRVHALREEASDA